jgi:hypothetical protein
MIERVEDGYTKAHADGNWPTNTWAVAIETRKRGALGIFEAREFIVRAEQDKVAEWALDDAHFHQFETRNIISMQRLK